VFPALTGHPAPNRSLVPKDGGSEAQPATKSAAASAHLKKSDAVVGDGNPASDGLAFVPVTAPSRGMLSAKVILTPVILITLAYSSQSSPDPHLTPT
jgi:hypothetical protein